MDVSDLGTCSLRYLFHLHMSTGSTDAMSRKKNNSEDIRKKICKPGLHMGFLPQLFRKKLGVFDFISPTGSHYYVSCLMSTLPGFKTYSVPSSCSWKRKGEGRFRAMSWRLWFETKALP